jgi:flagellar hook-associated protein 1 FlgK
MSGLFSTLNSSSMALNAHSRAIETSGKNLANVNNPNYARQRVIYGDRGTVVTPDGVESLGLEVLGVQQLRDTLLDRQLMHEIGLSGSLDTQRDTLQRAQAGLGQSINGGADVSATGSTTGGISAALDNFFNAFQDLASRPTDVGARQTLLQKAATLTDTLQETDSRLGQVQSDINTQVTAGVTKANTLLSTISDLNAQISRLEIAHPGAAVDLRDQRQARLEELAAILPIKVTDSGGGNIQVSVKDASSADIVLVDGPTLKGPVAFTGTGLTGGTPATAMALSGGSIDGALQSRDGAVQTLRDNLNLFTQQLVSSVNKAYNPSSTAGADFFSPAGTTTGTIALQGGLTASTLVTGSSGAAGDNSTALAVAGLASQTFSTGSGDVIDGTLGQFYNSSVSSLGQALATSTARASDQDTIQHLVRNQRDTVSGVSMDEEMADLVKYQRAFQASSRVFSVVSDLLDTVVNRLGN